MDNFTLILSLNNTFKYYFKYWLLSFVPGQLPHFLHPGLNPLVLTIQPNEAFTNVTKWIKYFLSPLKIFFCHTCLFGGWGKCHNLHLEVRSNLKELVLSFYHVGLWGSNSDSQSWGKCPYFMRHLTGPSKFSLNTYMSFLYYRHYAYS